MKRLFLGLTVLAVANLLGLLGAVGWLVATKRIDRKRVEAVRQLLTEPIPDEMARLEKEKKAAEAASAAQPEPLPETPPVSSEQLVNQQNKVEDAAQFRKDRMKRETQALVQTITLERTRLDKKRKALEKDQASFEKMRAQITAVEGEAQFEQAISVRTGVKPASAKAILQAIIDGKAGSLGETGESGVEGMDRAVAYLNKIDGMKLSAIIEQFAKDSPELAAQLLERLRTYGLVASASGESNP